MLDIFKPSQYWPLSEDNDNQFVFSNQSTPWLFIGSEVTDLSTFPWFQHVLGKMYVQNEKRSDKLYLPPLSAMSKIAWM